MEATGSKNGRDALFALALARKFSLPRARAHFRNFAFTYGAPRGRDTRGILPLLYLSGNALAWDTRLFRG